MKSKEKKHLAGVNPSRDNAAIPDGVNSDEGDLRGFSASHAPVHDSRLQLAVDLGLPSGTRWALCNVGANKPEEFGDHYAWGETEVKDRYDWVDLSCWGKERGLFHDLSMSIGQSDRDVAWVKWGCNWQMPTLGQMEELLHSCDFVWTKLNGVPGGKFTSKINGNSIFLPAAGYHWFDLHGCAGTNGSYWTSTQGSTNPDFASSLTFYPGLAYCDGDNCCGGFSVRPVLSV